MENEIGHDGCKMKSQESSGRRARKCPNCQKMFTPSRYSHNQIYCSEKECQAARRRAGSARYRVRKASDHGWRSDEVKRVKVWRKNNPGYWRGKDAKTAEAPLRIAASHENDSRYVSQPKNPEKNDIEFLRQKTQRLEFCLVGFVAQVSGNALRDGIGSMIDKYYSKGEQIFGGEPRI